VLPVGEVPGVQLEPVRRFFQDGHRLRPLVQVDFNTVYDHLASLS